MLLGDLEDTLILEERRAGTAERRISSDVNTLRFAKVDDFLLGEKRVVLNLVCTDRAKLAEIRQHRWESLTQE